MSDYTCVLDYTFSLLLHECYGGRFCGQDVVLAGWGAQEGFG